jgi:hypothetical protein
VRHGNAIDCNLLHGLAACLEQRESPVFLGSGPRGAGPLIRERNGLPGHRKPWFLLGPGCGCEGCDRRGHGRDGIKSPGQILGSWGEAWKKACRAMRNT